MSVVHWHMQLWLYTILRLVEVLIYIAEKAVGVKLGCHQSRARLRMRNTTYTVELSIIGRE